MISTKSKVNLTGALISLGAFLTLKVLLLLGMTTQCTDSKIFEHIAIGAFVFFFVRIARRHIERGRDIERLAEYTKKLNSTLIEASHNTLLYEGNLADGGKILTKNVADSLDVDRCSIWMYDNYQTSIKCEVIYERVVGNWESGAVLKYKDFKAYFDHLDADPVIVANDAENHSATSCFKEAYLKPLGIKSMLDVPILYKGKVIGVICIESRVKRKWIDPEIDFTQILSSLYSFAYSVAETNNVTKNLTDIESFLDAAVLVSKADKKGKITYVNDKFTNISGWTLEEALGKDHHIVNSGMHHKDFWADMYKTTIKDKKIWNAIVTNRAKDGTLYHVDTYIKASFDSASGELKGFASIRQDVTKIIEASQEIEKKNTYLEHAAKILRHDMHSGINTYLPIGIKSLVKRLTPEIIKDNKLEIPIRMLKEGIEHTQKVYKGVYEFTNLVKKDSQLTKSECDIRQALENFLSTTSYSDQVELSKDLPVMVLNESLFCTAVDNLIRNGLKYNDSGTKKVRIYPEGDVIVIQDNGRGMDQEDFENYSKPYTRKEGQRESGTGLGLNICLAILKEHGFAVTAERAEEGGTKIKIFTK